MSAIAAGIAARYPDVKKGWGATVDRYIDRVVGPQMRLSLRVLMAAVVAVLLIGCANLANLLMARATLRSREIALRLALGAHRARLVRMLLTESLMLSAFGGLVGIGLGYGLLRWIQSLLPPFYFPAEASVAMDGRVLGFLAIVTMLTSVVFGLTPALRASRRDAAEALKEGGRSSSAGRRDVYRAPRVRRRAGDRGVHPARRRRAAAPQLLPRDGRRHRLRHRGDRGSVSAARQRARSRTRGADAVHPAGARRGAGGAGRPGHGGGDGHPAPRLGRRHAVPHAGEAG